MVRKNVDMLSGSITIGLLSLTMPIMIMNVVQNLFNIVDMTVLKHFSDGGAVGAVGATGTLITLCTSILIGISAGANVIVAKKIGMGKKEKVERATVTAVAISALGGLILMIIGILFADNFLKMINCPESLFKQASLYFKLYFIAIPAMMLYNFSAAVLRACGDTKSPMYFLIIGGFIKCVLTVLFVSQLNMDVGGVGVATIISNVIIGGCAFYTLLKNEKAQLSIKKIALYAAELKEILFIGVPSGLQMAMYSLANVIIMTAVNSYGADATTGVSIANQFDGIMYNIIYAPSLAAIPYIAQNIGAGNIGRVKKNGFAVNFDYNCVWSYVRVTFSNIFQAAFINYE